MKRSKPDASMLTITVYWYLPLLENLECSHCEKLGCEKWTFYTRICPQLCCTIYCSWGNSSSFHGVLYKSKRLHFKRMGPLLPGVKHHSLQQSRGDLHHRNLMVQWWILAAFLILDRNSTAALDSAGRRQERSLIPTTGSEFHQVRRKSLHWKLAGVCMFWHCSKAWLYFPAMLSLSD